MTSLAVLFAFVLPLLLHYRIFDVFSSISSLIIMFFLTGFMVINCFEPKIKKINVSSDKLWPLRKISLSIPLSFLLNTAIVYFAYQKKYIILEKEPIIALIFGFNALLLGINLYRGKIKFLQYRNINLENSLKTFKQIFIKYLPLWVALITYGLVHAINAYIYPFIPEADSYFYINQLKQIVPDGHLHFTEFRPSFQIFTYILNQVSGINPIILFKWFLPLIMATGILPIYLTARSFHDNTSVTASKAKQSYLNRDNLFLFLASIFCLLSPMLIFETELARPQSLVILFAIFNIRLNFDYVLNRRFSSLMLSLIFAILPLSFHEATYFNLLFTIIVIFLDWFIRSSKKAKLIIFIIFMSFAIGVIILAQSWEPIIFIQGIREYFTKVVKLWPINWWFIDNYTNVDGVQVGWPGIQALYYYGYNLGLAIPLVLIYCIFQFKNLRLYIKNNVYANALNLVAGTYVLLGLLIAEILPRFNVFYLPDRAWLYVITGLCIWLIIPLSYFFFESKNKSKILFYLFILAALGSIITAFWLTNSRQGWMNKAEYPTAVWIKNNTPKSSLIISQMGNMPLITGYGEREITSPENFFLDPTIRDNFLKNYENSNNIYILYSEQKFTGLYGTRAWWLQINQKGANLSQFNSNKFILVHNQNGVYIWKYNTSTK